MTMKVLILGIGNLLLRDESVGIHAVNLLAERYQNNDQVEIVDGGTAGMELLDWLSKREYVIFVDAVLTGGPAGSVITLHNDEIPAMLSTKISPHQLGLSDLLGALKLLDESPKHQFLVGIVPADTSPGLEMSKVVKQALPTMIEKVISYLIEIGIHPTSKRVSPCV
ncbi:HyaD/HybD family hydrogenase maturation endopeptidase [Vibrio sonorensis]|uniref:HyaD/HybD family hydrogenase maturation endopeptidase n=1 Tax=Vibrio sonorensis TaxID=1004316 RepID=UPI001C302CAB|nr:HyaD/HybD family hydrogenase maturation endopeptidase [Vibrio sonorensis]